MPSTVLGIAMGQWSAKVLETAIEVGLFDFLSKNGPSDQESIDRGLELDNEISSDFLGCLTALKLIIKHQDGRYENTEETQKYCTHQEEVTIQEYCLHISKLSNSSWKNLKERLLGKKVPVSYDSTYKNPSEIAKF